MTAVLKWTVPVDDEPHEVGAGPVALVACQSGSDSVQVWTVEKPQFQGQARTVQVFGTGQTLPDKHGPHVGSVITAGGSLVWHVMEVKP